MIYRECISSNSRLFFPLRRRFHSVTKQQLNLFAVCTPGLEKCLEGELVQLGLTTQKSQNKTPPNTQSTGLDNKGGLEFTGDLHTVYTANLWLRTAHRILLRIGEFYVFSFSDLRKKTSQLPWEKYLTKGQTIAFRATCLKSRLFHSSAVIERVAHGIALRLGEMPRIEKMESNIDGNIPQLIMVRLSHDLCTISIDTSGEILHRRGYRLASAKAPIRETLAAGMLMVSGWDQISPILDPFCGSGTILIEAALMAGKIPPGAKRSFAFMKWPKFNKKEWDDFLHSETSKSDVHLCPLLVGSDRDAGAIKMAQENAKRAGVENFIKFTTKSISAITPEDWSNSPNTTNSPKIGWVVTNPPYGIRLSGDKDLRNLYCQFGNILKTKCPSWHVAVLCTDNKLLSLTGFGWKHGMWLDNGGVKVKLAVGNTK